MKKTISFASVHFCVAFTVTYILTRSLIAGGIVALIEPAINTIAFHIHERTWERLTRRNMLEA